MLVQMQADVRHLISLQRTVIDNGMNQRKME